VFAPLRRLGIVIVDEEHESSYKQDDPAPRYDAREVARRRAEGAGAVLLLGSATPSLESIHAVRSGRMRVLRLPQRVNGIALPPVHVSDMREELRRGNRTVFSDRLRQAIVHRLAQREQTMLLLNRRGFSTYVFCRDCGHVELCPNCRVSLTYHQRAPFRRPHGERRADARDGAGVLVCHHCLHVRPTPTRCRECGGQRIRYLGLGTQQVEEETRAAFPDARVARMDTDTTARKGSHGRILAAFRDGQYDILIGTQMIAKGLDFPNVTLVGVILAETSLFLPDFRAAERAFCLLTQVAGRSGRSPKGGEVVFQTYRPDHYSIAAAQRHDYDAFCEMELPQRDEHHYPPFTHALRVLVRGDDENAVIEAARQLGDALADVGDGEEGADTLLVRGPAPAPLARLRGQYRWHLLLRAERPQALRERALAVLEKVPPATHASVAIVLDMDPVSLL
jgi:primosomal protein N' (replication factor Y)